MIIYIVTKNGKTLTDAAIHSLLDKLAMEDNEKKIDWVYRCGPSTNDPIKLINELDGLKDPYKVIAYESSENWRVVTDEDLSHVRKIASICKVLVDVQRRQRTGEILFSNEAYK